MWRINLGEGQNFHNQIGLLRIWYKNVFLVTLLLVCLRWDVPQTTDPDLVLDRTLAGEQFNLTSWIAQNLTDKLGYELLSAQRGLSDAEQVQFIHAYMRQVDALQRLESQIQRIYADPKTGNATEATANLRSQRDALRQQIEQRQNLAEAILQEQVETELRSEGFAWGGQIMPPVRFRFTNLPDVLIVSRRDKIERIHQRELRTGLTVDEWDTIERSVDKQLDVSSLVEPIGGMGTYPTMLPETTSIDWLVGVIAHEWLHNYVLLSYVGLNYASDPTARVINETTASIVEDEMRARIVKRFYPELIKAQGPTERSVTLSAPKGFADRDALLALNMTDLASDVRPSVNQADKKFDFNKEMRETRLRADELLAQGKIDEAEAYMEQRRGLFVENGFYIRKLNQAYFAFHGAYNATPGGAPTAGRDPIGPAVQALRRRSKTLGDFVRAITRVTSLEDLKTVQP